MQTEGLLSHSGFTAELPENKKKLLLWPHLQKQQKQCLVPILGHESCCSLIHDRKLKLQ